MLYFISWLTDFALLLFIFVGTRLLAERGASSILMGGLGASFFLASVLSNACSGSLGDRFGRRPVALTGMTLLAASLLAAANSSPKSGVFYAAYTCVGFAIGFVYPPIMAWLGQGRQGREMLRTYLFFCLAFNAGIISSQLTGGWMYEHFGSRVPLFVAIGLTTCGLIMLANCRDTTSLSKPTVQKSKNAELSRAFARLSWISNFGGMFSMSMLWFLFPVLVVSLKVPATMHGIILALGRTVVLAAYCLMYLRPYWQFRFRIAVVAQLVGVIGMVAISTADSASGLALGVAAISAQMGFGYFASLAYNADGAAHGRKGRAFGFNEAFLGLGAAGGSFFGGLLSDSLNARAPFALAAGLIAFLLLVQSIVYWRSIRPLVTAQGFSASCK